MRNLVFAINITVDGCCDHTKGIANEELHEHFAHFMRDGDLLVYGRKTYQLMVPFWPDVAKSQSMGKAANEFARAFESMKKLVFSKSLDSVEERNTRIVRGNLRDEVLKLKQAPGKNILTGGLNLPAQLIQLGLVDKFHVVVHPVVVGEGRRLLDDTILPERFQLKLLDSKTLKSGHVALRYSKQ